MLSLSKMQPSSSMRLPSSRLWERRAGGEKPPVCSIRCPGTGRSGFSASLQPWMEAMCCALAVPYSSVYRGALTWQAPLSWPKSFAPTATRCSRITVSGCLHLKSACSYIGDNTILVNRSWIESERLSGFELLDVPEEEPAAANALLLKDSVIIPASFPNTRTLLEQRGFDIRTVDVSELQKAEAGMTCCSLIFNAEATATS